MPDPQELKDKLNLEPIDPPSKSGSSNKSTSNKSKSKSKKRSTPTDLNIAQIKRALQAQIELLGTLVLGLDGYDGQVIIDKSEDLADALTELAKTNRGVRVFLERLIATGAWSGVATILVGEIAIPIAVHHGALPEPINSVVAEVRNIPVKDRKPKDGTEEDTDQVQIAGI